MSVANSFLVSSTCLLCSVVNPDTAGLAISRLLFNGVNPNTSPSLFNWVDVKLAALPTPSIANLSFSLASLINLTMPAPAASAAVNNSKGPGFTLNKNALNLFGNIFKTVDKANATPLSWNTIPESFPKLPPAIEATPARDVRANVPPIILLLSAPNFWLDIWRFLACSFTLLLICGLIGAFAATVEIGAPWGLVAILLPLCVPPTAALDKLLPALATSSCLSAIPTSRPRAMSWPILLVLLDGEAVCASFSVALIADLALFIPIASKMAASSLLYLACCPALIPAIMFAPPPVPAVCAFSFSKFIPWDNGKERLAICCCSFCTFLSVVLAALTSFAGSYDLDPRVS